MSYPAHVTAGCRRDQERRAYGRMRLDPYPDAPGGLGVRPSAGLRDCGSSPGVSARVHGAELVFDRIDGRLKAPMMIAANEHDGQLEMLRPSFQQPQAP